MIMNLTVYPVLFIHFDILLNYSISVYFTIYARKTFSPYLHLRKQSSLQSNVHIGFHTCFYYCYFNEYFYNYDFLPSRCPESAAEEDISFVALLAPISSKQMHLSLFTISPILPLTTHQRQVINTEEKQFIFIACNHSKHPHGLFVPPRQEGRQSDNTPLVAEVHYFT